MKKQILSLTLFDSSKIFLNFFFIIIKSIIFNQSISRFIISGGGGKKICGLKSWKSQRFIRPIQLLRIKRRGKRQGNACPEVVRSQQLFVVSPSSPSWVSYSIWTINYPSNFLTDIPFLIARERQNPRSF